jgi:3-methyladenine DNA glycosylase AlkC
MAEPLKRFFERGVVERIAAALAAVDPAFPARRFVDEATAGLDALELLGRGRHIAAALRRALPDDFPRAVDCLVASLGPEAAPTEGAGMAPFLYLPHVIYVAEHGLAHFEAAMHAQYELTKRFTAEFSIRAFLERYPEETLARLHTWVTDASPHVRRLVSEGTRPRLPWAPRLRAFQADPRPVLALLERLKDDPDRYVIRSVANNLNDIGKDHPDLLLAVCTRWLADATPERRWLVRHALRSLTRRGDAAALALLGFRGGSALSVEATIAPARVRIGGAIEVTVTVRNASRRAESAALGLAVHFVKADGRARPKNFRLGSAEVPARGTATLRKRISFAPMTTRRHYPGRHRLDVLVNGRAVPAGSVLLLAPGTARPTGR